MNMNTRASILVTLEDLKTRIEAAYAYVGENGTLDGFDPLSTLVIALPGASDRLSHDAAIAKSFLYDGTNEDSDPWWIDSDTRDELHVYDYED